MVSKKIVLHFPGNLVGQPIICKLVKEYSLEFNILKASIASQGGLLVIELKGQKKECDKALAYLGQVGVKVQPLSKDIIRNEKRCTHCGVCVAVCPTEALTVEPKSRKVDFDNKRCIACRMCVKVCPLNAMQLSLKEELGGQ